MRKIARLMIAGGLLLAIAAPAMAQTDPSDEALLTAFDEARFFAETVTTFTVRITSKTPDETREALIRLRFKEIEGEAASRIEFLEPEELAGQVFLNLPGGTYFVGPDLDFPLRTSATTEVFGDAAVAQTSGIRFREDYTVAERRVVARDDGTEALEVDLAAVDFSVAFQEATVVADRVTLRPLSVMLTSGLPFYEVLYEAYEVHEEGDLYVKTQRIVNQLLLGNETVTEIVDIGSEELPDALFDPDELGGAP